MVNVYEWTHIFSWKRRTISRNRDVCLDFKINRYGAEDRKKNRVTKVEKIYPYYFQLSIRDLSNEKETFEVVATFYFLNFRYINSFFGYISVLKIKGKKLEMISNERMKISTDRSFYSGAKMDVHLAM